MERLFPPRLFDDTYSGRRMPEKFGRYLLIERIGAGGMAEVFRAVTFGWEGFRRVIVVKRIRRELSQAPEFLQMFSDEAKISALLHHPNVVQVYDFGQVDGAYFLAMELIDGKNLGAVLRAVRDAGETLPPSLVAFIGHEMAQGLHYAHTLVNADGRPFDIVHRDVNPSNVMLTRTGGVKLLDFGIAKASEAAGKIQTERALLKGKLSYLSPEQARCEPIDARADLFSWGSTVWELLTGRRLFGGKTDFERLTAVKHAPVMAPSRRRSEVPEALDRIVLRALERDPARRYQTAAEIVADLEAVLRSAPPEPDGVQRLLAELFGEESSKNIAVTAQDLLSVEDDPSGPSRRTHAAARAGVAPENEGGDDLRTVLDPSLIETAGLMSSGSAPAGEATQPTQPTLPGTSTVALWTGGAALLIAVVALAFWSFRARPVAPAAVPMPALAAMPAPQASVRIEIDSEPPGARVFSGGDLLGQTPFSASLPASGESQTLRFEKPGFAPSVYELRPQGAGAVFVELHRASPGSGAPGAAP